MTETKSYQLRDLTLFPASRLAEALLDTDQGNLEVEVSEEVPINRLEVEIEIEEVNQEVEVLVHIAEVAHCLKEGGEMEEVFHMKEAHIQEAIHRMIEDVAVEVLLLMAEEEGGLPVEDLLLQVLLLIEGLTVGVCHHIEEDFREEVFHHLTAKDFQTDLIAKVQAIGDLIEEVKISHHPGEEDILDHTVEVFLLK